MTRVIPWRPGMPAAIVVVRLSAEGLGEGAIMPGASSFVTFRVDPSNEMVIVMTRNAAGLNDGNYHDRCRKVVVAGMVDPAPAGH